MARTISEIKNEMTRRFISSEVIQKAYKIETDENKIPLKPFGELFSKISIENILFYITAFSMWTMEKLFDLHKAEVNELLAQKHPHTLQWYASKAKAFMYGKEVNLGVYDDEYDTSKMTDEEINKARIITYAACQRSIEGGRVFLDLKVAKGGQDNKDLEPLNDVEKDAFIAYLEQIKDAGVYLRCVSEGADHMWQKWTVYYDPQVLDGDGNRLDGTEKDVVRTAVKNYLKNLPFNGKYVRTFHVDAVQAVDGVKIPVLNECKTKVHIKEDDTKSDNFKTIDDDGIGKTAYSGWFKFYDSDDDPLVVTMEPYYDDNETVHLIS
ncbi:MAG: hypothetical protein FWF54_00135 [Candidatus Azobacteroides sp.]|nr:hypothetical protein [Candidatus Azobacteroides sp.]